MVFSFKSFAAAAAAAATAFAGNFVGVARAGGLVDHPIQGAHVQYLDTTVGGQKWTAKADISESHQCSFVDNTDYDEGPVGQTAHVKTPQECCDACAASSDCAAGVLFGDICYFKRPDEVAKPVVHQGRTACKVSNVVTKSIVIPASVPGDLLTDLQTAGQIGDPLYELNWLNSSLWEDPVWTYSTQFQLEHQTLAALRASGASAIYLVFDGIKMGATVSVNNHTLGQVTDQFRRYLFELNSTTLDTSMGASNTLSVAFDSSIEVGGRFMSCTGGWDWAPYTNTFNMDAHTFSKGIWKNVYLVTAASVAVEHIVPQIFYRGDYPTTPLQDGSHSGFDVGVRVHFRAAAATTGTLTLVPGWGTRTPVSTKLTLPAGNTSATINTTAEASDIKLWWPANTGRDHSLYNLTVSFQEDGVDTVFAPPAVVVSRQVGFRHVALVTGNDTDPAYVAKAAKEEGTELGFGMFFRINGAAIFTRGANMIPMEELEGRMNADAHALLVQSAVDANFNILRVWGGGMFLPDVWYDECDKQGILVYHDMQYAQQGHSPAATAEQDAELRHQVRRLSHHPSIIMWDGCNECRVVMHTGTAIYATFVLTVVAEEDKSRAIWPSCPALGWTTGVDRLTVRPNGNELTTPADAPAIETHGPYQHGSGWPSVNGPNDLELFDANIPITIAPTVRSVAQKNVYASEFGSSVMSSFESMSPTLAPEHWGIHGGAPADTCSGTTCEGNNTMAQRNYPCDNIIDVYFGKMDLTEVGEQAFKKQLYLCMLGQALLIKSNIETRRSLNELGIIVWQYNEIWPTGGWGSIEYGTPVQGQVIGGRWKPLQHFYKQSIYTDVMATCGAGGQCYVTNDGIDAFVGTLSITAVDITNGSQLPAMPVKHLDMAAGIAVTDFFALDNFDSINPNKTVLVAEVRDSNEAVHSNHVIALAPPANWEIQKATVNITSVNPSSNGASIVLKTNHVALYVTLTTLATGRFSTNAFIALPGESMTVQFIPFNGQKVDMDLLRSSLRVEHLASYLA